MAGTVHPGPDLARRWLDWAREYEPLTGGEDLLAGTAFPRFWTRGGSGDAQAIRYAAASLMARGPESEKAISILIEGRATAPSDADRLKFDLALAAAYATLDKPEALLPIMRSLLRTFPDSDTAFNITIRTLTHLKKWDEAQQVISERLARIPEDHTGLSVAATIAMLRGETNKAIDIGQKIVAKGVATPGDLNNLAWSYLLANRVTAEAVQAGQKAVFETKSENFGILHTLASLYAEIGKPTEAREVILQAMEAVGEEEPSGSTWYVFGRIAEQYGIRDAALADYQRVEKPKSEEGIRATSWALAQRRIEALAMSK